MSDDRIRDPGLRWVESGVSGLARPRQWDATSLADVAALRGHDVAQVEFRVRADGSVVGDVPPEAVPALTAELGLEPPYTVRAVRRSETAWAVGALGIQSDPIERIRLEHKEGGQSGVWQRSGSGDASHDLV